MGAFEFCGYRLSITADPVAGGAPSGASVFACNSSATIHANTSSGYAFAGWTPTDGIDNTSAADTKVAMTQNRNLTAHYTLTTPRTTSQTTIASSTKSASYGQAVTFTATVSAVSVRKSTLTPTGTVTFMDGPTIIASNVPLVSNRAPFTTNALTPGSHTITAIYNGDTKFNGSTSSKLNLLVIKAITSTTIVSSINPSQYGNSVTFTATISTAATGLGTPTGTVTFKYGSRTLGVIALDGSGQATYTTTSLSSGTLAINAVYSGDGNFSGSSRTLLQLVNKGKK
jgi:uncharacterized repeat protein (TIGR02543 family)